MPSRFLIVMALGLLVGAVSAFIIVSQAPPDQVTTGRALVGGPFSLVDGTGQRVTDKDFAGKRLLVFFGFTNCPDVCPGGLQVIAGALGKLGSKADKLAPIFITLDAERDTPQKTSDFAKSFSPRIVGLSGTPEETAAAAKAYRAYYKKVPGKDAETYNVDHSSLIYLMDEHGQYAAHFPYPITVDELASKLDKAIP